jgi:hypothetical protein
VQISIVSNLKTTGQPDENNRQNPCGKGPEEAGLGRDCPHTRSHGWRFCFRPLHRAETRGFSMQMVVLSIPLRACIWHNERNLLPVRNG